MRNKKQFHIYPVYFDVNRSRTEGRRVKKKAAVKSPSIKDLAQVATQLNLNFEENPDIRYPRYWWIPSGRLLIKKEESMNKNNLIQKIATQLKKLETKPETKPKFHS